MMMIEERREERKRRLITGKSTKVDSIQVAFEGDPGAGSTSVSTGKQRGHHHAVMLHTEVEIQRRQ